MNNHIHQPGAKLLPPAPGQKNHPKVWIGVSGAVLLALAVAAVFHWASPTAAGAATAPPASLVSVSVPLQRDLEPRLGFLGQFSAVEKVELRAQVGGTLTQIHFKDGDVVHKGDALFEIDRTPYDIKFNQAKAELESAQARLSLANRQFDRAKQLKATDAGTTENVDQRTAEKLAAEAAVDGANALVRDAKFDLDHCVIVAPFTGRIGEHLVSVGNLVSGSRAGAGPTTLLAELVSIDPIYIDFDMSEADYMVFQDQRAAQNGPIADKVRISLTGESSFNREGTMNFVDNVLDRSSGTIHARATVPNPDFMLTPGGFARVRLALSHPTPALLVPDMAVMADQSDHIVMTLGANDVVTPKKVELGDLRGGLRVIRSGLLPTDEVIIDGIPTAAPGSRVSPTTGTIRFDANQDQD